MIVQAAPVLLKHRNQPHRECLYAWYPEAAVDPSVTKTRAPRDIYVHQGLNKDLLHERMPSNQVVNDDLLLRYTQSIAASERAYRSCETIDEALTTPWALHYEVNRGPATPNYRTDPKEMLQRAEVFRRLKSAPLVRSFPSTAAAAAAAVLTIPQPQLITPILPVTNNESDGAPKSSRMRAASAKARLNQTGSPNVQLADGALQQQRRQMKSAVAVRGRAESNLPDEGRQKVSSQIYSDRIRQERDDASSVVSSFVSESSYTHLPVADELTSAPNDTTLSRARVKDTSIPANLHHIHRPALISVRNSDKKPILRVGTATSQRRHRRNEPLLALTPIDQLTQSPIDMNGINLIYDPTLTLDDPSLNVAKYVVNGRLYLIKDQHYNVVENIDPSVVAAAAAEQSSQNHALPPRPKYYQTIPIETFQLPKPPAAVHYNASETFFYNTMPKRVHRYVINPNFISETLHTNKISLAERPSTAVRA